MAFFCTKKFFDNRSPNDITPLEEKLKIVVELKELDDQVTDFESIKEKLENKIQKIESLTDMNNEMRETFDISDMKADGDRGSQPAQLLSRNLTPRISDNPPSSTLYCIP